MQLHKSAPLMLFCFLCFIIGTSSSFSRSQPVALLRSSYTQDHTPNTTLFNWEMQGTLDTLRDLKIDFAILQDNQVKSSYLSSFKILILPNCKDLSRNEAKEIRDFVKHGGKLFATGFSSYRDETDQPTGAQNNFQLADLFGTDYLRFDQTPPHAGFLKWKEIIPLGRNMAIYTRPHLRSKILASWIDDDGKSLSLPENLNAAIVENESNTTIYAGENLFAPENSNSPEVQSLIASLLNRLSPGTAVHSKRIPKSSLTLPHFGPLTNIPHEGELISVGLPYAPKQGFVSAECSVKVLANSNVIFISKQNAPIPFQLENNQFVINGVHSKDFTFIPQDPRSPLKLVLWRTNIPYQSPYKFAAFRGSLILDASHSLVINRLPLEAYLSGVVSHEVPFYFHSEALKTMAVVARTFALKEKAAKKFQGYDICATVSCQAYDGLAYESNAAREAAQSTHGEVLQYNHRLADLPYHATCGGLTEDIQRVWPLAPVPYLRSVVDGVDGPNPITTNLTHDSDVERFLIHPPQSYCEASSRFRWKESYSEEELTSLFQKSLPTLLKHPVNFSRITNIEVTDRTPHGRVISLKIETDTGNFEIGKDQIRWLFSNGQIGLGGLQSTLFVIQKTFHPDQSLNAITLIGGGWGHGVGLCQFGAEGMAQKNFTYKEILSHYYPGTQLSNSKL